MRPAWCAVVSVLLLVAACSSGDGEAEASPDAGGGNARPPDATTTTTPTEAPGSQPWEVQMYVETLLESYDEIVNQIVGDPSVVHDRDDPLVEDFLALFPPGNDFAEASLEGWATQADSGITLEPASPDHPVNVSAIDGSVVTVDDDAVRFAQCAVQRYARFEDGEETDRVELALLPGEGGAVRVDGHWLLSELTTPPDMQGCRSGSEATP